MDPEKAEAAEDMEPAAGEASLPAAPDPTSGAGPAGGDVPPMRVTRPPRPTEPDQGGPKDRRPDTDEKR